VTVFDPTSLLKCKWLSLREKVDNSYFRQNYGNLGVCALAEKFKDGKIHIANIVSYKVDICKTWVKNEKFDELTKLRKYIGNVIDSKLLFWFSIVWKK
jgi:hypothetical protein